MSKDEKTNAMRALSQKKIPYTLFNYSESGAISGVEVVNYLKIDGHLAFKTLVTKGKSGKFYVFEVPVTSELDLKKAAKAVNEKNIEMVKSKELLPLTGYVHGGCSPIGMKKQFQTVFDISAKNYDTVYFSGGKIGLFIGMKVSDIEKIIPYSFFELNL